VSDSHFAKRLASLERDLSALEEREASLPERRRYSDKEVCEIGLVELRYICAGSEQAYAEYLAEHHGVPVEKARETAWAFALLDREWPYPL
jgi:hypothetical protein